MAYDFGGGLVYYNTGLLPHNMETGLEYFLKRNKHEQTSVTWSPYSIYGIDKEKKLVLNEIETMLKNDLPVAFAYYTADKDNPLILYTSLDYAKTENKEADSDHQKPMGHYMAIIGLYKYMDEDTANYEYILKIMSWGKVYYVRYDEYSDDLNYFSNILRIQ